MEYNSFITLNRKILEWEWYQNAKVLKLFIHCLLKANWKDKSHQGIKIKRSTFMTSYAKLSEETGLSVKEVRTALSKLVSTGEVKLNTPKSDKKGKAYTIVTICKYDHYQSIDENRGTERAKEGHREGTEGAQKGQLLTIDNKENKGNNNNNNSDTIVYKDVADLLLEYKTRRVYTAVQENCKLTQEQLDAFLDDFNVHVTTRGRSSYNFDDYASHFKNWLDIRIKNGGKDKNVKFLKKSRAL